MNCHVTRSSIDGILQSDKHSHISLLTSGVLILMMFWTASLILACVLVFQGCTEMFGYKFAGSVVQMQSVQWALVFGTVRIQSIHRMFEYSCLLWFLVHGSHSPIQLVPFCLTWLVCVFHQMAHVSRGVNRFALFDNKNEAEQKQVKRRWRRWEVIWCLLKRKKQAKLPSQ